LAYIANLGSIVLHVWYSHLPTLDTPDFVLIDLDPYECGIGTLARVALRFRDELQNIGLHPLVKTTGGTGLHLVIPLEPRYDYDMAKNFAQLLARRVNAVAPADTTLERTISKRPKGTVYLDFVQVGKGKTYVAPFSVRARDGAPVSMPLSWAEVEAMRRKRAAETSREMARWTIANVPALVKKNGDPWAADGWVPQGLEGPLAAARSQWG
jgi:bifunctional non-homologous end joining protein LigD